MRKDSGYDELDYIKATFKESTVPKVEVKGNDNPTDWKLFLLMMILLLVVSLVIFALRRK